MQLRLKVMEEKKRSTQRASKRVFKSRSKVEVEMEEGDSTSNTVRPPTVNTPVVDEDPVPCHQAVTKNHTPSSDGDDAANDDVSGNSVITVIPSEEPVSQSKFTPAMTEESAKIVFGSLKLGLFYIIACTQMHSVIVGMPIIILIILCVPLASVLMFRHGCICKIMFSHVIVYLTFLFCDEVCRNV